LIARFEYHLYFFDEFCSKSMISPWKPDFFDHSCTTHQWFIQNNWYWKLPLKELNHSPQVFLMVGVQIWFLDKFCSKSIISVWKPDFFDEACTTHPSIQWISGKKHLWNLGSILQFGAGFESKFCFWEICSKLMPSLWKYDFFGCNGFWIVMDYGFWKWFDMDFGSEWMKPKMV